MSEYLTLPGQSDHSICYNYDLICRMLKRLFFSHGMWPLKNWCRVYVEMVANRTSRMMHNVNCRHGCHGDRI